MDSVKIEIGTEVAALCQECGIKVEELFKKILEDLLSSTEVESDCSILAQFYVSKAISDLTGKDHTMVEDQLLTILKRIKDHKPLENNYSYSLESND